MLDPLALFWIFIWTTISSYGLYLLLTGDKKLSDLYVYGKSLDLKRKKGPFWQRFLLPKRYFAHFYIIALLIFLPSFAITITYYVPSQLRSNLCETLKVIVDATNRYAKIETADTLSSITALVFTLILMIIQTSRRLYECLFISVYSTNSKINLIHYLFGHTFYIAAALSTVCPILLSQTANKFTFVALLDHLITKNRAIAFILFIYASHYQQKCHKILASLRKDKAGNVISEQHYVPAGGPFEYVSCPHFLIEVILYFLILVVQGFNSTYWNLIFLMVLSTQTINATTEHRWYKKKYKDYPKERKAIFPILF